MRDAELTAFDRDTVVEANPDLLQLEARCGLLAGLTIDQNFSVPKQAPRQGIPKKHPQRLLEPAAVA
jgi:hypothetical protein